RAPFSDNPNVGARGQRTQQRILDAALQVFGEVGYHRCSIDRITKVAGCSRVSFYQYFSSKEDVFRHLAGQVARQVHASTEALGPIGPDLEGWTALRSWVARHSEIYERYEPVYQAFQAAAESDEAIAGGSVRTGAHTVALLGSRLATTTLPARQLDPLIHLLLECLTRTHDMAGILRSAAPDAYPRERVDDALADVIHRTLFGLHAAVNVHPPAPRRPSPLDFGPVMADVLQRDDEPPELTAAGRRTLDALLEAGAEVLVRRGFHRARVDDIVAAAGVSHGAFYRYFENKEELAQILAVRAIRRVSTALAEIPDAPMSDGPAGKDTALRLWLRRYNAAHSTETAVIRVWADASLEDPALRADSAAAYDWGRRQLARFLAPRDFGDVDTEAVIMVGLLGGFGARERSAVTVDSAAYIIERGLFGR
ncbi:MAG: TetR/AcrR family transcriptional regulator, partial [Acidimicrobiales bacterium]